MSALAQVLGHKAFSEPNVNLPPAYQAFYKQVYLGKIDS
jgi:hypothetical protein